MIPRFFRVHVMGCLCCTVLIYGCPGGGGGGGGGSCQEPDCDDGANANSSCEGQECEGSGSVGCAGEAPDTAGANELPRYALLPTASVPRAIREGERPAQLDLSDSVPTPCNQGGINTCVGWVGGYSLMTYLATVSIEGWGDLDQTQYQFSPTFIFNQVNAFRLNKSAHDSCFFAGTFVTDMLTLVRDVGCATWAEVPYTEDECQAQPGAEAVASAGAYKVPYFLVVERDVDTIKSFLNQGAPVAVTLRVGNAFAFLSAGEVLSVVETEDTFAHSVVAVGYDDELAAIKVVNSWGTRWADGGFGFIAYDIWEAVDREAYMVGNELASGSDSGVGKSAAASGNRSQSQLPVTGCVLNPMLDTDGDGYVDTIEILFGLDPEVADDNPDLVAVVDADTDGWPDETEGAFGTDPMDAQDFPFACDYQFPEGFFADFIAGGVTPDSSIATWGDQSGGLAEVSAGFSFQAIAAGNGHSLALNDDGSMVGWGGPASAIQVPAGSDFTALAADWLHGLALRADGSIVGWGDNSAGQLDVPAGNNFVAVAVGSSHSLALLDDGSLVAWGCTGPPGSTADSGQCDVPAGNNYTTIAAGGLVSLAIRTDGSLVAWGSNTFGQTDVPAGNDFTAIATGGPHVTALKADGSIVGWGSLNFGAQVVPAGNDFVAIAAGLRHNLALKADGSIIGWGADDQGQIDVPAGTDFVAIAAGAEHSLALGP